MPKRKCKSRSKSQSKCKTDQTHTALNAENNSFTLHHHYHHLSMAMSTLVTIMFPTMLHRSPSRESIPRRWIPTNTHVLTLSTTHSTSRILINLKRPHTPITLLESRGVILHVVDTRPGATGTTRRAPNRARPASTEGDIEDDLQIIEFRVDIAATGEPC
jgi:hypothetical protein